MSGPRRLSRHIYALGFHDTEDMGEDAPLQLTEREPFGYRSLPDNVEHTVAQGDTLFSIAARYFAAFPRGAGLWWIIADFQPDPIIDPTIALVAGTVLVIPSVRTISESIFSEARRAEQGL